MKNIDALIMEKLGNNVFIKEQLEINFSNERLAEYLESHVAMKSEQIITRKIYDLIDKNLEELVKNEVKKITCNINLQEEVESACKFTIDKYKIDNIIEEIIDDDLYDSTKEILEIFIKKTISNKLLIG